MTYSSKSKKQRGLRISYNSPVILSFALSCVAILILNYTVMPGLILNFFTVGSRMSFVNPLDYFRLFSHVLGHGSWGHLVGNLSFILLLGPILEEKYGSRNIAVMILVTALVTGLLNIFFFSSGLLGASGIVFMLIVLVSIVDIEEGYIPLTFVLVALIFVGREVTGMLDNDNISQIAHIIGGVMGGIFGFSLNKPEDEEKRRIDEMYKF